MLTFDFEFTPFDMNLCYQQTKNFYDFGWTDKEDLANDVSTGLLPADEYKKITGDDYEAPKSDKKTTTKAN
ncbi:MAG: XkdX family protein [Lactobacillus sp.]